MPIDVQDAIKSVCVKQGGLTEQEALDFMKRLETSKRLQLETWA
jgi:sulfite reductase alpha subunit-like flavoprotein